YVGGVVFSALEAHRITGGETFAAALRAFEPWEALVLVPAALVLLVGFSSYARAAWVLTARQRSFGQEALRSAPARYTGKIPTGGLREATGGGSERRPRTARGLGSRPVRFSCCSSHSRSSPPSRASAPVA